MIKEKESERDKILNLLYGVSKKEAMSSYQISQVLNIDRTSVVGHLSDLYKSKKIGKRGKNYRQYYYGLNYPLSWGRTQYAWYVDNSCIVPSQGSRRRIIYDALKKYASPGNPITRTELRKVSGLSSKICSRLEKRAVDEGFIKRISIRGDKMNESKDQQCNTKGVEGVDFDDLDITLNRDWKYMVKTLKNNAPDIFQDVKKECAESFYNSVSMGIKIYHQRKQAEKEIEKLWAEIDVYKREHDTTRIMECVEKINRLRGE